MKSAFLVLFFVVAALADYTYEEGVVVLNKDNFDQALAEFDYALIEFYAPWCVHCKQLAPEFASTAQQLAKTNPNIKLCKVDATVETDLASKFEIKNFPTLKFFVKGNSTSIPYEGGRAASDMVTWLKRKSGPASVEIKTVEDAEKAIADNEVLGFFFGTSDSEAYLNFLAAANTFEDLAFVHTFEDSVKEKYNVEREGFILFKKFEDNQRVLSDIFSSTSLKDFVTSNRHPTILPFDLKAAQRIFGEGRDTIFLIIENNEAGSAAEAAFRSVANDIKEKITISLVRFEDPMSARLAEFIGVDKNALPTIRIVQPGPKGKNVQKFSFDTEITGENIKTFVDDFKNGKLKAFVKSEPIPENSHDENVQILVGKNFKELVIDNENDVLVEYYSPGCRHCKELAPIYSSLATKLKDVDGLVIAKMDAIANEVEGLTIQVFPTIKFYSKGNKHAPIDFSGERTENGFIDFLKKHSSAKLSGGKLIPDEL